MKKTVSPAVAIALIVIVVVIVVYVFARVSRQKRTQFVPGVGIIDPDTGRPAGGGRGRRGGGAGGGGRAETGGERSGGDRR